jgi:hypothetical protein
MKRAGLVVLGLLLVLGVSGLGDEPKQVNTLMRRKLEQSQKVLEGVAVQDFKKIAEHAEELIEISKLAEWKVLKTARYELYSNEFRRNAETLIESAKKKNIDAAALAYLELTMTCVKCHKHVREERRTE